MGLYSVTTGDVHMREPYDWLIVGCIILYLMTLGAMLYMEMFT